MNRRLLLGYLLITLFVLAVHDIPFLLTAASADRERLTAAVERDASVMATYVGRDLEQGNPGELQSAVAEYRRRTGARVVITDVKGWSVADTDQTGTVRPENFADRPEVALALSGGSRGAGGSTGLGSGITSVAVPVASAGKIYGAVHIVYPSDVARGLRQRITALALSDLVTLAAVAVFGRLMATSVSNPLRNLRSVASTLADGDLGARAEAERGPEEVRALARTFNAMSSRLAELIAAQRAFVGDASHQLRTPLTAILLQLQGLRSHLVDDAAKTTLDGVIDEASRFSRLVEGLLTLARAEGSTPERQVVSVGDALRERRDLWDALATEKGVPIQVSAPPGLTILVAPGAIEQILDNLLANVIEVAPAGAPLVVRAVDERTDVLIEVADRGPGMSGEERRRAFDRFWRGPASVPGEGSGLGLSIVAQLAHANGGDVELRDHEGGGLVAAVRLARGPGNGGLHGPLLPRFGQIFATSAPSLSPAGATVKRSLAARQESTCASGSISPNASETGSARTCVPRCSDSMAASHSSSGPTAATCQKAAPGSPMSPTSSSMRPSPQRTNARPPASTSKKAEQAVPAVIARLPQLPVLEAGRPVSERTFSAMGTSCHVLVVGGAPQLADRAVSRVRQLEQLWSRFLPSSEISRLNQADGEPMQLSEETFVLVGRAMDAWRATAGAFDPTVIAALTALGYDGSFEQIGAKRNATATPAGPTPGCAGIDVDAARRRVRLPLGVGLDPGGIGKGLAADFVVAELLGAGAKGACVNLGGDTVCRGEPPFGQGWQVGVADPFGHGQLLAVLGLRWGAVATSTRLQRTWQRGERAYHHLIDPHTGLPSDAGIDSITVVAASGWWAEAVAKAAFVAGRDGAAHVMARLQATGLMSNGPGPPTVFDGLDPYLR